MACAHSIARPSQHEVAATRTHHEGDEAELADRAEREDELEVVLAHRAPPGEQHREQAQRDDDRPPWWRVGEAGRHAGHQVHAGLDHRGGVQVGAHRCRRCHRPGQPEVHWDDRRLRQRADEHQHDADRRGQPGRWSGDQLGQQKRAGRLAEDDDPDEHRQPARSGDEQRLSGGPPAGGPLGVVAHQQERQHRRELPEQVEQQHVVADHQPEHRAGERGELGGEARQPLLGVPVVMVEVLAAVEEHQCADAEHQHAHDRGQRVEP